MPHDQAAIPPHVTAPSAFEWSGLALAASTLAAITRFADATMLLSALVAEFDSTMPPRFSRWPN